MIVIKKNPNGDTRTAPKDVTFEQFREANDMHRHKSRKQHGRADKVNDCRGRVKC